MIGILGGTFDPVHYGHLRTALDVQQRLGLDEVRFIPCGEPAHRNKPVATPTQRLSMVRAAVAGQNKFTVDDREVRREGLSYMVDTLASLKKDFPSQSLCLILGTDAFNGLAQWHQWEKIFDYANIAVMQRPERGKLVELNKFLVNKLKPRIVDIDVFQKRQQGMVCFVPVTQLDISATKIRKDWLQGKELQFLLPDAVLKLLHQQNIY
ncbi:MAG: nicotinate-nucleotide adenylyltransferase [Woeseiaceae bacterium]